MLTTRYIGVLGTTDGSAGTHRIAGGGLGFIPKMITQHVYDRADSVSTADAFATAREIARLEGIWQAPAAAPMSSPPPGWRANSVPGHRVVTVQPDSGLKYLVGDLYR